MDARVGKIVVYSVTNVMLWGIENACTLRGNYNVSALTKRQAQNWRGNSRHDSDLGKRVTLNTLLTNNLFI